MSLHLRRGAVVAVAGLLLLGACGEGTPEESATTPPTDGACRMLDADDLLSASNDSPEVDCTEDHTAETFVVGTLPEDLADSEYDAAELRAFGRRTCDQEFRKFIGADESLALRTMLNWAWFLPTEDAWDDGARWYRCDVVGGGDQSKEMLTLPATTRDVLLGAPEDRWMACAEGPSVSGSVKVPCSEPHDWRAVTTIVVGRPGDPWPGEKVVEGRSSDYCSESVGAWLNYPVDFEYGYTWFDQADWESGTRRSVCWARTPQ